MPIPITQGHSVDLGDMCMNNLLPDIYSKTTDIPIINEADYIAEMFNDMLGNLIEEIFPNMTALSA